MLSLHRLLACFALGAVAVVCSAGPAGAHPFGPPSTARVTADGDTVKVSWLAAEDDWVALGQSLGAFEDPSGAVSTSLTGEEKLQRSPAVRDYLLERITVSQQGRPCTGSLETLERLIERGARLTFRCPAPVTDVDVTLGALTDLNEAYRTVLTADSPATPGQALFTAAQATQHLSFSATGRQIPTAVVTLAIVTGALVVVGASVLTVRGLRRRAVRA